MIPNAVLPSTMNETPSPLRPVLYQRTRKKALQIHVPFFYCRPCCVDACDKSACACERRCVRFVWSPPGVRINAIERIISSHALGREYNFPVALVATSALDCSNFWGLKRFSLPINNCSQSSGNVRLMKHVCCLALTKKSLLLGYIQQPPFR